MARAAWSSSVADVIDVPRRTRPLRVAIAGFGVVGQAVARILSSRGELRDALELTRIFNRDVGRKRVGWVDAAVEWTERIDDVLAPDVDVLVEVVGGVDAAHEWVSAALSRGISVVTANKLLMAHHGRSLAELAAARNAALRFEAAVAGGVPVINAIERGIAADRVTRVAGILNGTCNYVLSQLAATRTGFEDALSRARELGFAEADPSSDVDGTDAAAKLVVLAAVGFHLEVRLADVRRESIARITPTDFDYAGRIGCTIRQVAVAERHGEVEVDAFVGPALVPFDSPLARVNGPENLVLVTGKSGGDVTLSGRGAGGDATAVAVVSDLLALARGERRESAVEWQTARPAGDRRPLAYYVRFVVRDRPGILASFAAAFAQHDINVDAVFQETGHPKSRLPFVMTLEPCPRQSLAAALHELETLDVHEEQPLALPRLPGGGDVGE